MRTKLLAALLILLSFTINAQTLITSSDVISVTTGYVNNISMSWIVTGNDTSKPLIVKYNVGIEYLCDFVDIYSIASDNTETFLVRLSGIQSGSISSVIPSGKVKIVFSTDVSMCYQNNSALYSGINITFATDTSYPSTPFANSYISGNSIVNGNVGIGVLNPYYKLEVNGSAKFYEDVQCANSISFRDMARFWVTQSNVPTLRSTHPQFSMPQYGVASPETNGSADLWLSGNGGIRMFTAGNPNPIVNINTAGNVGIGTINPGTKLQVSTATSDYQTSTASFSLQELEQGNGLFAGIASTTHNAWLQVGIINPYPVYFNLILQPNGGNVGIGTTTPTNKFEVVGNNANYFEAAGFYNTYTYANSDKAETRINIGKIENNGRQPMGAIGAFPTSNYDSNNGNLVFYTRNSQNMVERVRISKDGNVLIGTTVTDPTNALLTVNGTIHAKEVNVTVDIPADYVFSPTYELMPLKKVEQFVKANSHLPEIPSADEITKNGMSVGEMQNKLLQKIEELTLYVIDQQKQIEELKAALTASKGGK